MHERVGLGQPVQDGRGLLPAGQLGRGFPADLVQDAGGQQHLPDFGRLGGQHLLDQVTGQRTVLGDQLGDELLRVGMSLQGHRGQPQARRPALGALGQARRDGRGQPAPVLGQQQARFAGVEGEIAGPDLGQLTVQPVAVQPQQRVHPRGNQQAQAGPGVPQHEVQAFQHLRLGQHVEVIEDQQHRLILPGEGRGEPEQERVVGRPPPRDSRQYLRPGQPGPPQRRHHVGPEHSRPVVVTVQPDPGHRPGLGCGPQRQGHRLSGTGRAGEHGQRVPARTLADQPGDPRPRYGPVRYVRHRDLRGQDRIGGGQRRPREPGRLLPGTLSRHRNLAVPPARQRACRSQCTTH